MKVYVAAIARLDETNVLGVYSTEDVAISKVEQEMDRLMNENEEYGCYSMIMSFDIDDVEDYT